MEVTLTTTVTASLEEFRRVSADMEKIHSDIGLKATYADIKTDPQVLKKLGKENEDNITYAFL